MVKTEQTSQAAAADITSSDGTDDRGSETQARKLQSVAV